MSSSLQPNNQPFPSLNVFLTQEMAKTKDNGENLSAEDAEKKSENAFEIFKTPEKESKQPAKDLKGIHLNGLDTELSSGIEHYLPTPMTRLRITKDRLVKEIKQLSVEQQYYTAIEAPTEETLTAQWATQQKMDSLQHHLNKINGALSHNLRSESLLVKSVATAELYWHAYGPNLEKLDTAWQKTTRWLKKALSSSEVHQIQSEQERLNTIYSGFEQRLQSNTLSEGELITIINAIEKTTKTGAENHNTAV